MSGSGFALRWAHALCDQRPGFDYSTEPTDSPSANLCSSSRFGGPRSHAFRSLLDRRGRSGGVARRLTATATVIGRNLVHLEAQIHGDRRPEPVLPALGLCFGPHHGEFVDAAASARADPEVAAMEPDRTVGTGEQIARRIEHLDRDEVVATTAVLDPHDQLGSGVGRSASRADDDGIA